MMLPHNSITDDCRECVFTIFGKNALSNLAFSTIVRNCVAAIGAVRFSWRGFGRAIFYFLEAERMKKAITILLALVMVLSLAACGGTKAPEPTPEPTSAPTPTKEPTPIEALSSKEKLLFNAIIKFTKEDFYEPSKIRVLDVGDYTSRTSSEYGPDTVIVQLQGQTSLGSTATQYYIVVIKDGENKNMEEFQQHAYNAAVLSGDRYKALQYKGKVGDYGEAPDYYSIEKSATATFNVGKINKAIAQYWDDLGIS